MNSINSFFWIKNNFLWFRDSCNFSIDSIQMSYCEWIKKMNEFKKRCFELNVRIIHWWSNHNDGWPNRFVFKQTKKTLRFFFACMLYVQTRRNQKLEKMIESNRIKIIISSSSTNYNHLIHWYQSNQHFMFMFSTLSLALIIFFSNSLYFYSNYE